MAEKMESFNDSAPTRQSKRRINPRIDEDPEFISFWPETEDTVNDAIKTITELGKGYAKVSRQYVRDNPITGMAMAAAAGFFAGSLMSAISVRNFL